VSAVPDIVLLRPEMIQAGDSMAAELVDAAVSRDMQGLGGCGKIDKIKDMSDNPDLIDAYLDGTIGSVGCIFLAMHRRLP